jgi:hypothetical protein
MNGFSSVVRISPALVLCFATAVGSYAEDAPASGAVTLREGAPVSLAFSQGLSSKTAVQGDSVTLTLVNNLVVDGVTVAKAGGQVFCQASYVKRAAPPGKSGSLSLQLDYLQVGEKKVKLRGSKDKSGVREVQYSAPYHLKWPMGLLRTGDDIELKPGTTLTVFVAEDISLPDAE